MEYNEELVVEPTENVDEQATEELVEGSNTADIDLTLNEKEEPIEEKIYTESEFNKKLDDLIPKKIEAKTAKIKKEYEKKLKNYQYVEQVLNAGLGTKNIEEALENLKSFYTEKGIEIPQYQESPSQYDMEAGAEKEAKSIMDLGYEEIVDETDRLAKIGVNEMTPRDKIIFHKLAEERKRIEQEKELNDSGITLDDINTKEFNDFSKHLDPSMTLKEKYEFYLSNKPKQNIESIGSMKNSKPSLNKDYYSPEDIKKLTDEQLDDPKIWETVRRSMTKGN